MIDSKCFSSDWISSKRAELGGGDPTLIEKTIHAFALLYHLARRPVPLVFKGGTALMLRLPKPKRLSIDVDIQCSLPDKDLETILAEIGQKRPFFRHEEDPRDPTRLPARRHFKFFYKPYDSGNPSPHVILDVVKEEKTHLYCDQVPITSPLLVVDDEVSVEVPTIEGLLGDKLTAFAPNTVGIPCREGFAMQVMKQLFDVGTLFDTATEFSNVARTYDAIFGAENRYRGNRFSRDGALDDTLETARQFCHSRLKGAIPHEQQTFLEQGRRAVASHLIGCTFSEAEAKVAAAKAACLAATLRRGTLQNLAPGFRYDPQKVAQLKDVNLPDPVLQRLRGGNPEAFYYWAIALGVA